MAVVVHNNKILIAQRKKTMKQGGLWEFPGGKIEPNETAKECICREFMEELGMVVYVGDYLDEMTYTYPDIGDFHFLSLLFSLLCYLLFEEKAFPSS